MEKCLISIIVPVYNVEQYLAKCVESIRSQTYQSIEIILVDDGATDHSGALCDSFAEKDTRIRVIHKPNGGVSSARNTGIDAAAGEYITFCDSDDYLEPDYLEQLLRAANDNPSCGHIWCGFQTVTGYQKENAVPNMTADEQVLYYTQREFMTLHELWLDTGPWNKLYRTEVIRVSKLRFPEDLSLGEDWLFNLAYLDASPNDQIAVVTKPLYNYVRGNNESLDSKYRRDLLEIYRRLCASCLSYLRRWNLDAEQMEKFYNSRFYMYEKVLSNTMRNSGQGRREKIAWNNALMQSEEFKEVLRMRTCFVHPIYLSAYRSGNYRNVMAVDKLYRVKHSLDERLHRKRG